MSICPHCHQTIGAERFGVRLTPMKAAILDRIRRSGDIGVTSLEIVSDLYRERRPVSLQTVKAHTWQLNILLEETSWVIRSERDNGSEARWFLRPRRVHP
jgi:Fe2+ or Zn2+ uptake regulation protein